jgi:hypothetical protein
MMLVGMWLTANTRLAKRTNYTPPAHLNTGSGSWFSSTLVMNPILTGNGLFVELTFIKASLSFRILSAIS